MPPRPPLAITMVVLLVASSLAVAAGAPLATATPDDQRTHRSDATCAIGTTAAAGSASQNATLSTWTAPASAQDSLQSASDLRNAIQSGRLTPDEAGVNYYERESVATGDVVVHRIELNGSASTLLERIDEQDQGSPTQNFRALVQANDSGVEFEYIGPTACPPQLALNASIENGSFSVVPDPDRDVLYLVVDVEGLYFELGRSGPVADRWNWGRHEVSLTLRESSGIVRENTIVEDDYDVDERRVEFTTEREGLLEFAPAENQTVTGTGSMAPGTTVMLELVPFERPNASAAHTATATLDRNGTFRTSFDLASVSGGTLYRVRIPDTPRADAPHRLVAVGNVTGASLTVEDHAGIGTMLSVSGVTTTHGGFIVTRNDSTTVAVSEYLEPGARHPQPDFDPLLWANSTLTVTVYRDSNDDRAFDPATDQPYRADGTPVQETVNVTVDVSEREATTQTTTTQPTTSTTTRTATQTTTTTDRGTTTTTNGTSPGFGPGIVLLALLIGVRLVARD